MSYKDPETTYTYDKDGNVLTCTITQYGGVGTNVADGSQVDTAFPDPVVIDMAVTQNEAPPQSPNSNQTINIGCGWGAAAHEHLYMSLAPAQAQLWFTYYYRINLGPPYGWVTLVYDTQHFNCQTIIFPAGFSATFHQNTNQAPIVAHASGTYSEFDAHCG